MDPDPTGTIAGAVAAGIILTACALILSLGEAAFDALGDARIRELEEDGNRRALRIRRMTENGRGFAARIRVGTLACTLMAAVAFGTAAPSEALTRLSAVSGRAEPLCGLILQLLIALLFVCGITILTDRLPRRLAQKNPEKTALAIVPVFRLVYAPVWLPDRLCALVLYPLLRLCRIDPGADTEPVTEEDILELIDAGEETGTIEGTQKDMVNNIFEFDDIAAAEIMTPRTDVVAIEADEPVAPALAKATESGYSRIPVYEGDIDHVIGILYIKDLLPYVGQPLPADVSVRSLLRETHFVPDTKKCDDLFEEMTERHLQMAIIVDEYGGVAGIVTMEDLLESIVGNMQDEFDDEEEQITRLDDHSFSVDGSLNISEMAELLDMELPEGDYDTVAGFLMDQLGHIPEEGERAVVEYGRATFTIQQMEDRRIEQVLVCVTPAPTDADGAAE